MIYLGVVWCLVVTEVWGVVVVVVGALGGKVGVEETLEVAAAAVEVEVD